MGKIFMVSQGAVGVTGEKNMLSSRGRANEVVHTAEGLLVDGFTKKRLGQVSTDHKDETNGNSDGKTTSLLPVDASGKGGVDHNGSRKVSQILQDDMALNRSANVLRFTLIRAGPRQGARVLIAVISRMAVRVQGRGVMKRSRSKVSALEGLLKTENMPETVLGDVRDEGRKI